MKEIRSCEIKASEDMILTGLPIVFNQTATINDGGLSYNEVILPTALDGCDISDTRLLYNHDNSKVPLARTPKTMKFNKSSAGLEMIATLPDTAEAKSIYAAVKRGDLTAMSFGFKVSEGGDSYDRASNTRTIHKIDKVYEVSVTPYPAYSATSVEARSRINAFNDDERTKKLIELNNIILH
ncbi:HK97 family phage prohead protease [Campylobacter rectus]